MHRTKPNDPMQFRSSVTVACLFTISWMNIKLRELQIIETSSLSWCFFFICFILERYGKKISEHHGSRRLMVAQEMEWDDEDTSKVKCHQWASGFSASKILLNISSVEINAQWTSPVKMSIRTISNTHSDGRSRSNTKVIYLCIISYS